MHRITTMLAFCVLAGLLCGCQAAKEPDWDFGKSFHTVFENQKLDPNAGGDTPVTGMDGAKAALAYDRYEKVKPSEKEANPSPIVGVVTGK